MEPIVNWNGFHAHPENTQLSLLCSENFNDRLLGINTILKIRQELQNKDIENIRQFRVPKLDFSASHISEICDFASFETEAPAALHMTELELRAIAFQPLSLNGLQCHTTAYERAVQITTSSALVAIDPDMRDAASFNKISARKRNENARQKK